MSEKFVGHEDGSVLINASVTRTDDAGKAIEKDGSFSMTISFGGYADKEIYALAARTVWITIQGFLRKHWASREEIRDKTLTMQELSEFFQRHSAGRGGFGMSSLGHALLKTAKYSGRSDEVRAICADPMRTAKAEAWLKAQDVPDF